MALAEDAAEGLGALQEALLAALLPPEEVVLAEDAPVAAGLRRPQQVLRLEEGEDVEGELLGEEGDEVPLHQRLNQPQQVAHLRHLAELAGDQRVEGGDALAV